MGAPSERWASGGEELIQVPKELLSYEGGNLYGLDDSDLPGLGTGEGDQGGLEAGDDGETIDAEPLGILGHLAGPTAAGELTPLQWARQWEASKRAEAEELRRAAGPKLAPAPKCDETPMFKFGAENKNDVFVPDFPFAGPART